MHTSLAITIPQLSIRSSCQPPKHQLLRRVNFYSRPIQPFELYGNDGPAFRRLILLPVSQVLPMGYAVARIKLECRLSGGEYRDDAIAPRPVEKGSGAVLNRVI